MVFLGQLLVKGDSRVYGVDAVRLASAPRPGYKLLPTSVSVGKYPAPRSEPSSYFHMGEADPPEQQLNTEEIARKFDATKPNLHRAVLDITYCMGTGPRFFLETRPGASPGGFSTIDLISAASVAYAWCYAKEGPRPPQQTPMLNRRASYGPFHISMHDLSDLALHTSNIRGVVRKEGEEACAMGAEDTPTACITLGVDS